MGGLAGWCGILSPSTNKNMTPTRLELAIFWFEVRRLIQLGYEAGAEIEMYSNTINPVWFWCNAIGRKKKKTDTRECKIMGIQTGITEIPGVPSVGIHTNKNNLS